MHGLLWDRNNGQVPSQSILAEGILNLAAQGERDPKRLRAAALALAA
jgi:hypothetical protein